MSEASCRYREPLSCAFMRNHHNALHGAVQARTRDKRCAATHSQRCIVAAAGWSVMTCSSMLIVLVSLKVAGTCPCCLPCASTSQRPLSAGFLVALGEGKAASGGGGDLP